MLGSSSFEPRASCFKGGGQGTLIVNLLVIWAICPLCVLRDG